MASFKSYNNTDPSEIMKFIDSYQKQLYPDTPSTDFTDILQKQDAQEAASRQANYQRDLAQSLPETTDTLSEAEAIMKSARKYGQADQLLKAQSIKDEEELNNALKELGLSGGSDEEIRDGYKKALMGDGKIREALSLDKADQMKYFNPKTGLAGYDPTTRKFGIIAPGTGGSGGGEGGNIIVEVPSEFDPTSTTKQVFPPTKAGKAAAQEAVLNGGRLLTQAESESSQANSKTLAEKNALNEKTAPGYLDSLLNSLGLSEKAATS